MSENPIGKVAFDAYMRVHGSAAFAHWENLPERSQEDWHKIAMAVVTRTLSEVEGDRVEAERAEAATKPGGQVIYELLNGQNRMDVYEWRHLNGVERSRWDEAAAKFLAWASENTRRVEEDPNPFELRIGELVRCPGLLDNARVMSRSDHGELRERTYNVAFVNAEGTLRALTFDESDLELPTDAWEES